MILTKYQLINVIFFYNNSQYLLSAYEMLWPVLSALHGFNISLILLSTYVFGATIISILKMRKQGHNQVE